MNNVEDQFNERTALMESLNQSLTDEIAERRRSEEELLADRERLRTMNYEMALGEELHRRRFAQCLLDDIGQCLSLTQMKLGEIHQKTPAAELGDDLEELMHLIGTAANETYALTMRLSPLILYDLGLAEALQWLTESIAEKHRMEYDFQHVNSCQLPTDTNIILFRAVEELLNNVVQHAKASMVRVRMWTVNRFQGISVEDDGLGFEVADLDKSSIKNKRFGLVCIRERLDNIGGVLEIQSELEKGTQVKLWFPAD